MKQIATLLVASIIAAMFFCCTVFEVHAAPEDEAGTDGSYAAETEAESDDGYEPTEYRLNNENINEWEDRVLKAGMEPLENEGRVYYAYGEYVDELVSYFAKDDLDLTENEANDAINQIKDPANARTGAQSGYLYQIGGKPKQTDSLIEEGEFDGVMYPEFDETVRFRNETEYKSSALYLNNQKYIDQHTNTVYESKSAMREEMKQLAAADRSYQHRLSAKPASASITKITAPAPLGTAFVAVSAFILLLTIATIIFGWKNSTVSILLGMDDESWNRGNSKKDRHRIREISAVILAAIIAIDLVVVYAGLTYHSTYGSNNYIEKAMDEAGVCQHGYMDFRDDVHAYLEKQNLPQNSLDLAMTYRSYRFDYIKGTRYAIKNGSEEVTYRGIQDSIEAQIDLMAYVTKKDSAKIEKKVNDIYTKSLSTSVGMYINNLRASIDGRFLSGYIMSIISLILAGIMIVFERHSIYRGIGNLAAAALVGTALWGAITAAVAILYDASRTALADDAVYVTNMVAGEGLTSIMLILLGISAIASLLLFATSKIMQKRDA